MLRRATLCNAPTLVLAATSGARGARPAADQLTMYMAFLHLKRPCFLAVRGLGLAAVGVVIGQPYRSPTWSVPGLNFTWLRVSEKTRFLGNCMLEPTRSRRMPLVIGPATPRMRPSPEPCTSSPCRLPPLDVGYAYMGNALPALTSQGPSYPPALPESPLRHSASSALLPIPNMPTSPRYPRP